MGFFEGSESVYFYLVRCFFFLIIRIRVEKFYLVGVILRERRWGLGFRIDFRWF